MIYGPIMSHTILLDDVWSDKVGYNIFRYTVRHSLRESSINADLWHFNLLWVYYVVYIKIEKGRRRERDFVYRCNCYQNMPPFAHVKSTALLLYWNDDEARPVWILWFINMWPIISASCFMPSHCRRRVQAEYTLILVLVVFARCIIKTSMVPVQSDKLLIFLSSPFVWGHIYIWHVETFISERGHTHKT